MARSSCLRLAPTRSGSRSAALREDGRSHESSWRGRVSDSQGRVKSLPATLPLGSQRVPRARKRPVGTCCPDWPCECRGDWIRTSDLLNPIQVVAGGNIARISHFTAYKSHASHILPFGPHIFHRFQGVSCSFLHSWMVMRRRTKAAVARPLVRCANRMSLPDSPVAKDDWRAFGQHRQSSIMTGPDKPSKPPEMIRQTGVLSGPGKVQQAK